MMIWKHTKKSLQLSSECGWNSFSFEENCYKKKFISKMNKTIKITFIQWIFLFVIFPWKKICFFSGWKNLVPPLTPPSTNGDHFCFQIKKFQHFLNDKWMNGKIEKLLFEVWFNEMKCIPPWINEFHVTMNGREILLSCSQTNKIWLIIIIIVIIVQLKSIDCKWWWWNKMFFANNNWVLNKYEI